MFVALNRSVRLWRSIEGMKSPEVKLFRKFLVEKYSVDELSFFLEMRHGLLGLPVVKNEEKQPIMVSFLKCKALMEKVLGSFSPVVHTMTQEAEKFVVQGQVDYAQFIKVMLKFYQNERRQRRNAVRLMFQSKKFSRGSDYIDFENFVAMVQTLGFQGSIDGIFDLYREALVIAGGDITLDAMLTAMDNLSFHFYSIELPERMVRKSELTVMTRQQLISHWTKFQSWFSGFTKPKDSFDGWVQSKIGTQARIVDKLVRSGASVSVLYKEYRNLLDLFQFMADILVKGAGEPLPARKSERQLYVLENLIDLLVTFLVRNEDKEITFTEFE
jgi:hypothetical protein